MMGQFWEKRDIKTNQKDSQKSLLMSMEMRIGIPGTEQSKAFLETKQMYKRLNLSIYLVHTVVSWDSLSMEQVDQRRILCKIWGRVPEEFIKEQRSLNRKWILHHIMIAGIQNKICNIIWMQPLLYFYFLHDSEQTPQCLMISIQTQTM